MPNSAPVITPLFTANNVDILIDQIPFGFCENFSAARSVGRTGRWGIGSPIYKDAPVTTAQVTVQMTNLIPASVLAGDDSAGTGQGESALQNSGNVAVTNSLAAQVGAGAHTIQVCRSSDSAVIWQIESAQYNGDTGGVASGDIVTYNVSWIAPDTSVWSA